MIWMEKMSLTTMRAYNIESMFDQYWTAWYIISANFAQMEGSRNKVIAKLLDPWVKLFKLEKHINIIHTCMPSCSNAKKKQSLKITYCRILHQNYPHSGQWSHSINWSVCRHHLHSETCYCCSLPERDMFKGYCNGDYTIDYTVHILCKNTAYTYYSYIHQNHPGSH